MHLNGCVPKITLFLVLSLMLTACGGSAVSSPESRVRGMRSRYQDMERLTAKADITADYGDRVYSYNVSVEGNVSGGSLTVEAPENIAGTVLQWSDGTTSLSYEDVTLETGPLTESGLSPADAVPVVLSACRAGSLLECSLEETEDSQQLYAKLEHPDDAAITASCWFDPDTFALQRCELAQNGKTVITFAFSNFTIVPAQPEGTQGKD